MLKPERLKGEDFFHHMMNCSNQRTNEKNCKPDIYLDLDTKPSQFFIIKHTIKDVMRKILLNALLVIV